MSNNGTPLQSFSVDGREFQATSESNAAPEQGGWDSEYQSNSNPNTGRFIMTPTGWSMPEQSFALDPDQNDWEYLNDKKNAGQDMDLVFTWLDAIYTGRGRIVGKLPWDSSAASGTVAFMGPGKIKKQ